MIMSACVALWLSLPEVQLRLVGLWNATLLAEDREAGVLEAGQGLPD